jgi:hypothetical protein
MTNDIGETLEFYVCAKEEGLTPQRLRELIEREKRAAAARTSQWIREWHEIKRGLWSDDGVIRGVNFGRTIEEQQVMKLESNTDVDLRDTERNPSRTMFYISDITKAIHTLPNKDLEEVLRTATAELVSRARAAEKHATASDGPAEPRPRWAADRQGASETPAAFITRAYARELAAGGLHKGIIHREDPPLYRALFKWLADPANELGFDLPTKAEWNNRRLASVAGAPVRSADLGLYEVALKRRAVGSRRTLG